ncbi:class I SAM-dependent methyltransferase [Actinokineospora sp. HUAS TT18]|uniref:class I SAM-dependent methyltransferase n=1 Tax=Actinokineospora sp. HUAS TT18 TaxID=3447451 RepID=UPI003F523D07
MEQSVRTNWQNYWSDLPQEPGLPIWDSSGQVTATAQLPLFQPHFAENLPLLDIGCGNGTQTAALAAEFPTVIGLDFAPAAIDHARALQADSPATFREYDLADPDAAVDLHLHLGDSNIYMRGVLHQMPDDLRPAAVTSLRTLMGATGHLFAVELSPAAGPTMQAALAQSPDAVPKLQRVFRHGLKPASWQEGKLEALLENAGIEIIDGGMITLHATDTLPDGSILDLPMAYVVARNR